MSITPEAAPWSLTPKRWRLLDVLHALHVERLETPTRGHGASWEEMAKYTNATDKALRSLVNQLQAQGLVALRHRKGVYLTYYGFCAVLSRQGMGPLAGVEL